MAEPAMQLLKGMGREVDQIILGQQKLKNAFKSTAAGGLLVLANQVKKFTLASARAAKDVSLQEAAISKLSIAQTFLNKHFMGSTRSTRTLTKAFEFLNANTDDGNKHFMGMAMKLTTLIGTIWTIATFIGILVIGLSLLSLAFQGSDSPILKMTENMGILQDITTGLATAFDPSTGGTNLEVFISALALAGVVALLLTGPIGLLVGGLVLASHAFHVVKEKTGSVMAGIIAAGAVIGLFVGLIMAWTGTGMAALGSIVAGLNLLGASGSFVMGTVQVGTAAVVAGMLFIVAGLAGLVAFAMGAGSGLKAFLFGFASAALVAIGLMIAGVLFVPAVIVGAILLVIASIIRYRQEIWAGLVWVKDKIMGWAPVEWLVGVLGKIKDKLLGILTWVKTTFINPLLDMIPDIGGMLGGLFSGGGFFGNDAEARAGGGPVTGGRSYIVGEKGPEMFTPGTSGNITPNDQMGGGQTINMSINVSGVTDRTDKRDLAREIGDMINQELRRQGGATTRGRF